MNLTPGGDHRSDPVAPGQTELRREARGIGHGAENWKNLGRRPISTWGSSLAGSNPVKPLRESGKGNIRVAQQRPPYLQEIAFVPVSQPAVSVRPGLSATVLLCGTTANQSKFKPVKLAGTLAPPGYTRSPVIESARQLGRGISLELGAWSLVLPPPWRSSRRSPHKNAMAHGYL